MREGAAVDSLGVVVDGRLAIRLNVPGRGVVTVLTVEPGDFIGWSALVPPHRATSTVVALEPTTVVTFDGPALRAALDADPALAAAVLRRVLDAVARRLAATRTQLLDLFARAEQRTVVMTDRRPVARDRPAGCRPPTSTGCSTRCAPTAGRSSGRPSATRRSSSTRSLSAADLPAGLGRRGESRVATA